MNFSSDPNQLILVHVTSDDQKRLELIVNRLVSDRWVACAQIMGQLQSTYWWQGQLCHASEFLLIVKTTVAHWSGLQSIILELHNYEVPEIVAVPVFHCSDRYRQWWLEQLRPLTDGEPTSVTDQ